MTYVAPTWTLSNIITEVRGITGRPDATMMSNDDVVRYINYYYQYVLTKELKIFWGYSYYNFFTQAGVDQYLAPNASYSTFNPSVWADGFPVVWYLSPDLFYQDYPQQENKAVVATGVTGAFSFNISAYPVMQRSVYVTDGIQVLADSPVTNTTTGTFYNTSNSSVVAGAIDYTTGAVTGLTFPVAPAANANVTACSQTYMANRPQGILYFPSQTLSSSTTTALNSVPYFVIRPVPDQVYKIKMQGMQVPAPFTEDSDVPFRPDLGPLIAIGASMHIFKLFNQMDQYNEILVEYLRYKDLCMQDTYEEYLYQRSVPAF